MQDFLAPNGRLVKDTDKTVLIDGDMLVYAAASAADGRAYRVLDGRSRPIFKLAAEANEYLTTLGLSVMWRETLYVPDPVENCLHSLKLMLYCILEQCNTGKYTVFLSGKDNFRLKLCPMYKANRVNIHRPFHLLACREYLLSNYNTRLCHGVEADDALGIQQMGSPVGSTIIASLDKDLDMIPGWHFRWSISGSEPFLYWQDRLDSQRCFWTQVITGDATDNIEGLSEKAPKKRTYKTKPIESMVEPKEMYDYVLKGYVQKYKDEDLAFDKMRKAMGLLEILGSCEEVIPLGNKEYRYIPHYETTTLE